MEENKKIIFDFVKDITIIEVIEEVLNKNGLQETAKEVFAKYKKGQESYKAIIQDAALALFENKIPEKKLAEFLAKHLETSQEVAEKIVKDVNEKLIPFAQIIDLSEKTEPGEKGEKEQKEEYRQELLNKIRGNSNITTPKKEPPDSYIKKTDIVDVEENAENIQHAQQRVTKEEPKPQPKLESKPDTYREPIE